MTHEERIKEIAKLVISEIQTLPDTARRRLYRRPGATGLRYDLEELVENVIGKVEMLYSGDGRHRIPGMQRSGLYRAPAEPIHEEEREAEKGPGIEDIVRLTIEYNSMTKAKLVVELEELDPEHGLDTRESKKNDIVEAIVNAKLAEMLS